jgi:hypothetical protein
MIMTTRSKWTEEEIDFLKNNYELSGVTNIFNILSEHTYYSIVKKAYRLGLKVNKSIYYFDVDNVKKIVKESYSYADVFRKLNKSSSGDSYTVLRNMILKNEIDISHFDPYKNNRIVIELQPITHWLKEGTKIHSSQLKEKLYKEGLKERKCELCGQDEEWKGKHMSLILDHKNGVNNDNRLENLRIVCPNCNATLDTHCRGNKKNMTKR